jgi:O-acetyl-ADP-ribose deacetylase (regulator of RNase III)
VVQAATIAVKETANFLEQHAEVETVYFVCFDESVFQAYQQALESLHHE